MAQTDLHFTVSFAWWFKPYMKLLILFCEIHQTRPSEEAIAQLVERGIKIKFTK